MKFLASLFLIPGCLLLLPWALVLIPFYPYALVGLNFPTDHAFMFMTLAVELVCGLLLLGRWFVRPKDGLSIFLLLFPLLAVPALFNAGNLPFSATLTLCVVAGAGFYGYWRDNMPQQLQRRIPQIAFGVWLTLAFGIKFLEAAILHQPWWIQRSGGIWAANHSAGILILLLPFVRSRFAIVGTVLFVLTSNSRGVYFVALLIALGYVGIGYWKRVLAGLTVTVAAAAIFLMSLDPVVRAPIVGFLTERFFVQGGSIDQGATRVLSERLAGDERWDIQTDATKIASITNYEGVGLGGFQFALGHLGRPADFSNAHNLYLTSLAEGGIFFTIALAVLLIYAFGLAVNHKPTFAISLAAWCIYGFFSGELWEAAGMGTTGDYLTLVFVIAYLSWARESTPSVRFRVSARAPVPA
ncbi:MAG TPA: hypothetical protein VJ840_04015 [Gemmatimonadaceae bacterium]|nr:hypothetical protein [Gemmatimonadaceae bacterium]